LSRSGDLATANRSDDIVPALLPVSAIRLGHLTQRRSDPTGQVPRANDRKTHLDRAGSDAVFHLVLKIHQLIHLRQGTRQPRDSGPRQAGTRGKFAIAQPIVRTIETAENFERAQYNGPGMACLRNQPRS
jgi:hypothetical protein